MTSATLIAIGILVGAEVVCRLIAWRRQGVRLPGGFRIPVTSLSAGLVFLFVAGAAVFDLTVVSIARPGVTSIASGAFLFAIGWFLRYPAMWTGRLEGSGVWHEVQARIGDQKWKGSLAIRHQRYAGLIAMSAAIALISFSPLAAIAATLVPLVVFSAAKSEEDFAIAAWLARGEKSWPYQIMSNPLLIRPSTLIWFVPGPILLALFVGLGTAEISVFSSDGETARTLLLLFAGAQGTLLLFSGSALIVGMQLTGDAYSWRVVRPVLLYRYRLWAAGAAVGASIVFDLVVVARTDWPALTDTTKVLVDVGGLVAILCVLFVSWAALSMAGALTAEAVMPVLLNRINKRWMSEALDWGDHYATHPRDPMLPVVDLLSGVVRRGDVYGFRACIVELVKWSESEWPASDNPASVEGWSVYPGQAVEGMDRVWPNSTETENARALDRYLHHHMAGLIRRAASDEDVEFIDGLERFVSSSYSRGHPYVGTAEFSWGLDRFSGEKLLREIIEVSIRSNHKTTARSALYTVSFAAERLVKALPTLDETSVRDDPTEAPLERTEEQRAKERAGDDKIDVVSEGYGHYLSTMGQLAAELGATGSVEDCLYPLRSIIRTVVKADLAKKIQRVVIGHLVWSYTQILDEAIEHDVRIRYFFSPVEESGLDLPKGDQGDELGSTLCQHESWFIRRMHEANFLTRYIVERSIRLLWEMMRRNSEGKGVVELAGQLRRIYDSRSVKLEAESAAMYELLAEELPRLASLAEQRALTSLSEVLKEAI